MTKPWTSVLGIAVIAVTAIGGAAWWQAGAQSIPLAEVSHIHGIAVVPKDSSRLYLATHFGVFHTSADGTAEQVSENTNDYMGFTPHPTDADVVMLVATPLEAAIWAFSSRGMAAGAGSSWRAEPAVRSTSMPWM